MSVKELFTYSDSSQLDINTLVAKSTTIENENIQNITANSLEALNALIETFTVTGNSSQTFINASSSRYLGTVPSVVKYNVVTTVTNAISTLTATQMAGGIVLGNGSAIYKSNIDTAANLYAQVPLTNGQAIEFLCVNKTGFAWNFDLLDSVNVSFNNSVATPSIPANTQKYGILLFTGAPLTPSYVIYL